MNIDILHLSKHFGEVRAVDDVSFSFGAGEVVGFVGPNGAGKTTTMRILATLDDATDGEILIDGVSLFDYPERLRRRIGFMPDELPAYADMTAHEYIDFFGRAFGLRGAALAAAVDRVEDFTGIVAIREKTLNALSKGMKQRVCLARALVHDPALLIMDEPANGLDPRARIELRELVKALAEMGKAILVSSHILTELEEMCTGMVILERGRLLRAVTRRPSPCGTVRDTAAGAGGVRGIVPDTATAPKDAPRTARTHVRVRCAGRGAAELLPMLLDTPGVADARVQNDAACSAEVAGDEDEAAAVLRALVQRGLPVVEFAPTRETLEDVFMSVTKGDVA